MPSTATDRIDGLTTSVAVKAPVVAATTANITLSGAQTIDGVAVVSADRVLVKNQTTGSENGIYDVSSTAWTRAKDFNGARDAVTGTLIWDNNAGAFYTISTSGTINIGTTSIAFSLASSLNLSGVSEAVNIAAMTSLAESSLTNGQQILVSGYRTAGDDGGGQFHWDTSSADTPVSGMIINSDEAGTGQWIRSDQTHFTPEQFGAYADGANADLSFFNASATHMSSRGGTLYLSAKTYKIGGTVTYGGQIILQGQGIEATRVNGGADNQPFIFDNGSAPTEPVGGGLRDMSYSLAGNAAVLPIGLSIIDCWGFQVENVRFRDGGTNGVTDIIKASGDSFEIGIRNSRFAIGGGGTRCIYLADNCNSSNIEKNDFVGEDGVTGVLVESCNGVTLFGNHFEYAATKGGIHVDINNSNGTCLSGNSLGANDGSAGSGDVQVDIRGSSAQTQINGNRINLATTISGVRVGGTAHSVEITGNGFLMTGGASGVETGGRSNISITGNTCYIAANISGSFVDINIGHNISVVGNPILGVGAPSTAVGVTIDDTSTNITIKGNPMKNISTGIDCDSTAGGQVIVATGNAFTGVTTPFDIATATSIKVNDNPGFATEASGTAVIASGGVTSGSVAHGCDYTPDAADITITPTNDPTNDPGHFFVDSVDGTNIVIKCGADPGVSTATLSWSVRRR